MPYVIPNSIKDGDIVGFSGNHWKSTVINLCTGGLPLWGLSHVGIMATPQGRCAPLLFESCESSTLPCEITGELVSGVQAHALCDVLDVYNGKAWLYPAYRPLYMHERFRLEAYLESLVGKPYDLEGAARSAGWIIASLEAIFRGQDLTALFCSELNAACLSRIGFYPDANASRWNPNRFTRKLKREGYL